MADASAFYNIIWTLVDTFLVLGVSFYFQLLIYGQIHVTANFEYTSIYIIQKWLIYDIGAYVWFILYVMLVKSTKKLIRHQKIFK